MTTNTNSINNFTDTLAGIRNQFSYRAGHFVSTWEHDEILDSIYDHLREIHYSKKNLKLHSNYSREHNKELSAKSIYWDSNKNPKIICSILQRSCWPTGVFRILNRLWKPDINSGGIKTIDPGFGLLIQHQLEWCLAHGATGVFISRSVLGNWRSWAAKHFQKEIQIDFYIPNNLYLTCDNENDKSCWQEILFHGDKTLLNKWKCKR